jgi:hypothetical protein
VPFQTILMDDNGAVLESDNRFFNALEPHHADLKLLFPVLDSFFHQLKQLSGSRSSLLVQGVEQPSEQLNGIYDFVFQRMEESVNWLLLIHDRTSHYLQLIEQQQIAHQKDIFQDIQQEHSLAIERQTTALYRQGLDRMLRLAQSKTAAKSPLNTLASFEVGEQWVKQLNSTPPSTWLEQDVISSAAYREIQQKTAQHWFIQDSESLAEFEIHGLLHDLADYFTTRSDSNFIELNILYHPNMPFTKVRGNELLVRRALLGTVINTLKIGGIGSVSIAATPIEYAQNCCKIEFSVQVSWLPSLPSQLTEVHLPITVEKQKMMPPQTFNLLARHHCIATWAAEAGSTLYIEQQKDKGFKVFFELEVEKL